jgi:hypothetical protein
MAGLVPAIHVFAAEQSKTWMPATSAGMTEIEQSVVMMDFGEEQQP